MLYLLWAMIAGSLGLRGKKVTFRNRKHVFLGSNKKRLFSFSPNHTQQVRRDAARDLPPTDFQKHNRIAIILYFVARLRRSITKSPIFNIPTTWASFVARFTIVLYFQIFFSIKKKNNKSESLKKNTCTHAYTISRGAGETNHIIYVNAYVRAWERRYPSIVRRDVVI